MVQESAVALEEGESMNNLELECHGLMQVASTAAGEGQSSNENLG